MWRERVLVIRALQTALASASIPATTEVIVVLVERLVLLDSSAPMVLAWCLVPLAKILADLLVWLCKAMRKTAALVEMPVLLGRSVRVGLASVLLDKQSAQRDVQTCKAIVKTAVVAGQSVLLGNFALRELVWCLVPLDRSCVEDSA